MAAGTADAIRQAAATPASLSPMAPAMFRTARFMVSRLPASVPSGSRIEPFATRYSRPRLV